MRIVHSGEVDLAVYESGTVGAPTVVMIHGYPDNASVWTPVADVLAPDYHVVRYDVRGAGASTPPPDRAGYALDRLCADFEAVIDATSPEDSVHVVAHDWGSIQAWEAVTEPRLQHRIASYTSISGPCLDHIGFWMRERAAHPTADNVRQLVRQLAHSFYVGVFQLPFAGVMMGAGSRLAPRVLKRIEGIDAAPPASDLRNGVELYRANMVQRARAPRERRTDIPVQLVVLLDDRYVTPALTLGIERWAPNLSRREAPGGHWSIVLDPGRTAGWVSEHVQRVAAPDVRRRSS